MSRHDREKRKKDPNTIENNAPRRENGEHYDPMKHFLANPQALTLISDQTPLLSQDMTTIDFFWYLMTLLNIPVKKSVRHFVPKKPIAGSKTSLVPPLMKTSTFISLIQDFIEISV
ncbi:hypothetical protein J1N35_017189 [Gossypium stocksii]|uniref:Uncharacterized protein n=1 Tax=Gossypium stocksii TaxID=47602 RepID=A0A9D4A3U4_9ROSI|nr:hypothetical protein J1N35_017189 [Gossypium stocksii]